MKYERKLLSMRRVKPLSHGFWVVCREAIKGLTKKECEVLP
jgi:hypothetical protein